MSTGPASDRIGPDDPRYRAVVDKRFNKRFGASPDYVCLARSTDRRRRGRRGRRARRPAPGRDERRALPGGLRFRSRGRGDHRCLADEGHPFDAERGAVAVRAGATVGETFRALAAHWGVVVPLGEYPGIGMGGHVAGGAFGFLCRQLGLAADYLYAVEVVTVDADGRPRVVVATREPADPNRELWWAQTGAGGGNFGVVTRFWFRSPGAAGADPAALLPRAPESITTFQAEWSWNDIDRAPSCAWSATTGSGASGPATPIRPTPASGRCSRCTASSSGRSSSAASAPPATPPSGRWTTSSRRSARGPSRRAAASRHGCRGSTSR